MADEKDRPIASFLWPGNTADATTLLPVVERLRLRFGVGRVCVVADRGMISAATIAAFEAQAIDYILGVRERSSLEVRERVLEDDGVAVPLVIPRQKGETELAVKEVKLAGRRYIVCRNEEEARKDADNRAKLLADLERKLAQGDKALVANVGYRRFLAAPEGRGFTIVRRTANADAHRALPRFRRCGCVDDCRSCQRCPHRARPSPWRHDRGSSPLRRVLDRLSPGTGVPGGIRTHGPRIRNSEAADPTMHPLPSSYVHIHRPSPQNTFAF